MRKELPEKLEGGRVNDGPLRSDASYGACGCFLIQGPCGAMLRIIVGPADDPVAQGWEHASVSCRNRCPNWTEMSYVKDLLWEPEETVVQFHVPASVHINFHPHVLHLWRNPNHVFPLPPIGLV